jgi:hypothetical protein
MATATWTDSSFSGAMQSAFGTPNTTDGDFVSMLCDPPKISFENKAQELKLLTGQVGAAPERLVGQRSGTLTFSQPLDGFKYGYDPTTMNPGVLEGAGGQVIPPWMCLSANASGSYLANVANNADFWIGKHLSVSAYAAAGVTSAAAGPPSTVTLDAGVGATRKAGQLLLTATSATSTTPTIGYIKGKAGEVCTLFEPPVNQNNSAAAIVYGTATLFQSPASSTPKAMTFRWLGQDVTFCYEVSDWVCTGMKWTWEVGEVPTVEFTGKFSNFKRYNNKGGLVVPNPYARIPQIVGSVNGLAMLAGAQKCGLESCTLEWKADVREKKCHGAASGVSSMAVVNQRWSASFTVLDESTDLVYDAAGVAGTSGQHVWQSAYELGTRMSLGLYVGSQVGHAFAFLLPSALIVQTPQVQDRDGSVAYQLTMEAATYTADSTDTAETSTNSPLDSIARMSLG